MRQADIFWTCFTTATSSVAHARIHPRCNPPFGHTKQDNNPSSVTQRRSAIPGWLSLLRGRAATGPRNPTPAALLLQTLANSDRIDDLGRFTLFVHSIWANPEYSSSVARLTRRFTPLRAYYRLTSIVQVHELASQKPRLFLLATSIAELFRSIKSLALDLLASKQVLVAVLVALRSLPPTSLILLLTPVLRPATSEKANPKIDSKDPFEDFGRELSKMHQRLRHVPYVPKVGMIETHVAFIQQAAAVIVVICEPTESDSESLSHQRSFADAVSATGHGLSGTSAVPFVLVRFDADDVDSNDEEYENVLHATSLTKRASSRATQLLFKQEA
ncbi:hypothetical protein Q7P37_010648 [Cladosporium fusiforme]